MWPAPYSEHAAYDTEANGNNIVCWSSNMEYNIVASDIYTFFAWSANPFLWVEVLKWRFYIVYYYYYFMYWNNMTAAILLAKYVESKLRNISNINHIYDVVHVKKIFFAQILSCCSFTIILPNAPWIHCNMLHHHMPYRCVNWSC